MSAYIFLYKIWPKFFKLFRRLIVNTVEDDISLCTHSQKSKNTTYSWTWWFCSPRWIIDSFRSVSHCSSTVSFKACSPQWLCSRRWRINSFRTFEPLSLPKPVLHRQRLSYSSFNFQNHLVSLRSFSSCLRLLPLLPVTSSLPSTFLSITCFRRQFLRKMWPVQLAFPSMTVCRIFLSLTLCIISLLLKRSVRLIFSHLPQHHISYLPMHFLSSLRAAQVSATNKAMLQVQHCTSTFLKFKSNLQLKRVFFSLNVAFVMATLHLISRVYFASSVIILPKYLKYSTFALLGMIVLRFPLPSFVIRIRSNVVY